MGGIKLRVFEQSRVEPYRPILKRRKDRDEEKIPEKSIQNLAMKLGTNPEALKQKLDANGDGQVAETEVLTRARSVDSPKGRLIDRRA